MTQYGRKLYVPYVLDDLPPKPTIEQRFAAWNRYVLSFTAEERSYPEVLDRLMALPETRDFIARRVSRYRNVVEDAEAVATAAMRRALTADAASMTRYALVVVNNALKKALRRTLEQQETEPAGSPVEGLSMEDAVYAHNLREAIDAIYGGEAADDLLAVLNGERATFLKLKPAKALEMLQHPEVAKWLDMDVLASGDFQHGSYSTYKNQGCRCDDCSAANAEYVRQRRGSR